MIKPFVWKKLFTVEVSYLNKNMKLLGALIVIGVLSKADFRGLENGESRIINGTELDVQDYPFMVT
ncbi:unnamed protein product, partial [Callosobruchus maculatus]